MVQLADHISYAVFRYYESKDDTYFETIRPQFDSEGGRLHGLVHMHKLPGGCSCPACKSRTSSRRAARSGLEESTDAQAQ